MKKNLLSVLMLLVAAASTQAKSWKIGPASVNGMDFASINAAMNSSQVVAGDTLYLDQFYKDNATQEVNKRVVIIGTGYDTSLSDEQVVAYITGMINLKASGVVIKSVRINRVDFYNDDCTLDRCMVTTIRFGSSTAGMNHIYSCYIDGTIQGYSSSSFSTLDIQNCCIICNANQHQIAYLNASIIEHNTIINYVNSTSGYACIFDLRNTSIKNNIILRTRADMGNYCLDYVIGNGQYGNALEHNILSHNTINDFPQNKFGYGGSVSELFIQQGNYSDYYKLAEKSAALGYATDGGEVGCHGGLFGCPSGGRPQYIPYFSKVVVGSRTENGKLPVSVTVKIQDE